MASPRRRFDGLRDITIPSASSCWSLAPAAAALAGAMRQAPLATAGVVAVTAIDAADMGALAATVDGHDATGPAVDGTVTATYCAAA